MTAKPTQHVIIIGAGIIGVCSAYELARRGARVTLLDKDDIGRACSFGNAGIIALGHPPLNKPGLTWQAIKWMFDASAPLYIPLRFDPGLFRWLWQFRRSCRAPHVERCMKVLGDLSRLSIERFEHFAVNEHVECEYQRVGWLDVYRTESGFASGRHDAQLIQREGFEAVPWSASDLTTQEPAFVSNLAGAIHYPQSAFANPYEFVRQVADLAVKHGAAIHTHTEVTDIVVHHNQFRAVRSAVGQNIEGDTLLLAGGIWTTKLARSIGIHVPLQGGKGYHVMIPRPEPPAPCVSRACVLAESFMAATPINGALRLAGTIEFSGLNDRLVQRRIAMLTESVGQYLTGIDNAVIQSSWCGLRPCTPDGLPVIGFAPNIDNVFLATGHAKMGFSLGPATGRVVSECILDGKTSMDIRSLAIERFRQPHRRGSNRLATARQPVIKKQRMGQSGLDLRSSR